MEPGFPVPPWLPYSVMAAGEWRRAADAFGDAGWEYDRGLMLAMLDDPDARREAAGTAERLGARPLARYAGR